MRKEILKAAGLTAALAFCYLAGATAAELQDMDQRRSAAAAAVGNNITPSALQAKDWGLGFSDPGQPPTGTASAEELREHQAYFLGNTKEKRIYLTFDAGYENGNTAPILDVLKKHQAKAAFFVVGHYLETAPELVKRMADEGHTVGNHTWHHYDSAKNAERAVFEEEIKRVEDKYLEITGQELTKYYRPPQGKYSIENLEMAKDLGYHTFFWSLAYADWDQNAQPEPKAAIEKLTGRLHPGAVVLLHSTSQTNAQILDELLTKWEQAGYTFGTLDEIIGEMP